MNEDFPALAGGFRPGSMLAGYRLETQLGAGGMGVVFRAQDLRLGRPVALKILSPALASDPVFRRRFIAESRAAAVVDDPHIIPVYEADEADGVLYIAMRFVAGGDLRGLLDREGALSAERAVEFISPVASALDAAHAAGLVHRDVKPENILVDVREGRPDHLYLSDFGVSKGAMRSVSLTGSGFLGTPYYAAPEQVNGEAVDGRTDQYALACVTYRLLAGTVPFERDHGMAVLLAHVSAPPPSLMSRRPDLPGAVDRVLAKGMAKIPGQRYDSCGDFSDALRDTLGLAPYRSGGSVLARASRRAPGHETAGSVSAVAWTPTEAATGLAAPGRVEAGAPDVTRPPAPAGAGPAVRVRRYRLAAFAVAAAIIVAAVVIPLALRNDAQPPKLVNSPNGAHAVTHSGGGQSTSLRPTRAGKGRRATLLENPDGRAGGVAFGPGGTLAVGRPGGVYLWNIRTGKISATLADPERGDDAPSVAFGPSGTTLAAADGNGAYVWDVAARKLSAVLTDPGSAGALSVAFGPGGATLAVGDGNGTTYVWNVATRKLSAVLTDPDSRGVASVAFGPGGATLAVGDSNGTTYVWNVATRQISAALADPVSHGIESVAFRPGGKTLAVADAIGSTYLWNVATRHLSATLTDPASGGVVAVAFGPSGTTMAAADNDGTTYVWDIATRKISASFTDPTGDGDFSVAFGPGGATLAVAGGEGSIHLWDTAR